MTGHNGWASGPLVILFSIHSLCFPHSCICSLFLCYGGLLYLFYPATFTLCGLLHLCAQHLLFFFNLLQLVLEA